MTTEEKPKQFIGTLFSSKLGKAEQFERHIDDKITDMDDLEADAKLNLNRWLASLPNRLGYSIVIRKDPVDEMGSQQSGIWATLTLFITHISGKTTPIDTILLGPVEPAVRLELGKKTTTVENHISGFVQAAQVREIQIPAGSVDIFDEKGERVTPSTVASNNTSTPAPQPTQPVVIAVDNPPKRTWPSAPGAVVPEFIETRDPANRFVRAEKTDMQDLLGSGGDMFDVYQTVKSFLNTDSEKTVNSAIIAWAKSFTPEHEAAMRAHYKGTPSTTSSQSTTSSPAPSTTSSPAPSTTSSPASNTTTYVVKAGDTLGAIAQRNGVAISNISGYRSGNPNLIYPGEVLTIRR